MSSHPSLHATKLDRILLLAYFSMACGAEIPLAISFYGALNTAAVFLHVRQSVGPVQNKATLSPSLQFYKIALSTAMSRQDIVVEK